MMSEIKTMVVYDHDLQGKKYLISALVHGERRYLTETDAWMKMGTNNYFMEFLSKGEALNKLRSLLKTHKGRANMKIEVIL